MVELKRGTFLVLEAIQEYENSGKCIRMQGRYQGKPRRGILWDYGSSYEDNRLFRMIIKDYEKTINHNQRQWLIFEWLWEDNRRLWKAINNHPKTMTDHWKTTEYCQRLWGDNSSDLLIKERYFPCALKGSRIWK